MTAGDGIRTRPAENIPFDLYSVKADSAARRRNRSRRVGDIIDVMATVFVSRIVSQVDHVPREKGRKRGFFGGSNN